MTAKAKIWVSADHHIDHARILEFKREDGTRLRDFDNIDHMREEIIRRHNEIVRPEDHWYCLGDYSMGRGGLAHLSRFNGHKRLVRGNHDQRKTREYIAAGFEEIYGVRVFRPQDLGIEIGAVLSHIPLHPESVKRWTKNVHGHLHAGFVKKENNTPDPRYVCVSLEMTNYYPLLLTEIV